MILRLITGLALFLLFLFPYGTLDSSTKDLKNVYTTYEWILSSFIVIALAWLLSLFASKELKLSGRLNSKFIPVLLILSAIGLSLYLGEYSFWQRPHLIDSIVQMWQAKVFSEGNLYSTYNTPISFFVSQHMLFDEGKMYSQYPPGNSILLSLNYLFALPGLSSILAAAITLTCSYRFTKRVYNQEIALINLLLFLFSGFFLFNNQSFMNHVPGLAFAALFLDFYSLWSKNGNLKYLIFTGLSLGLIFICRPLEGALLVLLFSLLNFKKFFDFKDFAFLKNGVAFAVSFLSIASVYFIFNYYTTGNALLAGYIKLWGAGHELGFHTSPWGDEHTFLKGLEAFYINLKLLNEYLFESPIPPLSIFGAFLLLRTYKFKDWDKILTLFSFSVPFIYVFYWHRDSFLGPRYTYIALAFFVPLFSNCLFTLGEALNEKFFPANNSSFRKISLKNWFLFTLLLSLIYIIFVGLPIRAKVYASSFISMKKNLLEDLPPESKDGAIVFVKVSFGTRIIASLRELGMDASYTEKAYRQIDHCELWNKVKNYKISKASAEVIKPELDKLISEGQKLQKIPLNRDPSFRIKSEASLSEECKEEINYDLEGYSLYEPHMLLNKPGFLPPIIIARDMRFGNSELTKLYPGIKNYYLWAPGKLLKLNF